MTDFASLPLTGRRLRREYQCEKFIGGEWICVSEFTAPLDEKQLQRHAQALGGDLRLVRSGQVVRQWRDEAEVWP